MVRAVCAAMALGLWLGQAALACKEGDKQRFSSELQHAVQKGAWDDAERAFRSLEATKCDLSGPSLTQGAQAAKQVGKAWQWQERLVLAQAVQTSPELEQELSAIENNYGRVELKGHPHPAKRPVLSTEVTPFAVDQKNAIGWATTVVENTGSFKGMLPKGAYTFGDQQFTVEAGQDFVTIKGKKQ